MADTDWAKAELWAPGAIAAGVLVAAAIGGVFAWQGAEPEPASAEPPPASAQRVIASRSPPPEPEPIPAAPEPQPDAQPAPDPDLEDDLTRPMDPGIVRALVVDEGSNGTVLDIIEASDDDDLDKLFAEGMSSTVVAADHQPSGFRAAVQAQRPTLRECATQHATVEGTIEITLVVSAGRVTTVAVGKDTVGSAELRKCVSARIRDWTFASAEAGETTFTLDVG